MVWRLVGNRLNPAKDIIIDSHCWVGLNCIILKGSYIHSKCIVGAGSVCNKNYFETNCIIAGNPAKVAKKDINWDRKFL